MLQGQLDLNITKHDLDSIDFQDYFQCYQQTTTIEKYYNKYNSSIWQKFDDSPQWVHNLAQKLPQDFEHHVVSVINIPPGQTIPWHADKHYILQKNFGFGDTWRYLIFLEDWKPGHYFEIDQTPVVKWKAGFWIKFHRDDWHLAGNMGVEPFYSAQVTVK